MRCRVIPARMGETYVARSGSHYQLPSGLEEGSHVKALSFDSGYWTVETEDGRHFQMFATCLDTGMEYEWRGLWLPKSDPRIQLALAKGR